MRLGSCSEGTFPLSCSGKSYIKSQFANGGKDKILPLRLSASSRSTLPPHVFVSSAQPLPLLTAKQSQLTPKLQAHVVYPYLDLGARGFKQAALLISQSVLRVGLFSG